MVRGLDLKRQLANFGHRAAHRENLHHPATKERFGPCKGVESYCTNPPRVHGDCSSRCNQHSRESDHCKLLLVILKENLNQRASLQTDAFESIASFAVELDGHLSAVNEALRVYLSHAKIRLWCEPAE